MIDDQNMYGKKKSTDQNQKFSFSNSKSLSRSQTKKIKSTQGKNDSNPDKRAALLFQKDTDDRNNDNVTGGDKAGFTNAGVFDAKLLEVACKAEQDTTADTAGD